MQVRTSNFNGINFRNGIRSSYRNFETKIGLFGDIHFQDKGLDRINVTGNWIISEFKKQKVISVVCLGINLG